MAVTPFLQPDDNEPVSDQMVRFRTVGDATCAAAIESMAVTVSDIIAETAVARIMERLRFATVGSVDDGKSTLIGRLLFDSKSIFEDQLEHIEAVSKRCGPALLADNVFIRSNC